MKQTFTFLAALMMTMAMPKMASAYDFSHMLPNGIELFFNIDDGHAVVTYPGQAENWCYWCGAMSPWGSVTIPDSVTYNGTRYAVTAIGDHAFYMRDELTSIVLPNHITQIGDWAFSGCSALSSVSLPSSLVSIGKHSFAECSSLASIVIPDQVVSIGDEAFFMCNSLSSVTFGNSVSTIDTGAFYGCYNLQTVDFPNSLISIKSGAFSNAGLTAISFGNAIATIEEFAFSACQLYNPVMIPSSVTSIGFYAFGGARMLYYDGLSTGSPWGAYCVNGYVEDSLYYTSTAKDTLVGAMREITTANIPISVSMIGSAAFMGCTDLMSVSIPNSVMFIGQAAFQGCHALSSVVIPASVDTIGLSSFNYCFGLRYITFEGFNPPKGDDFFYMDTVHIPCGLLAVYSSAMPRVSNFIMPDFNYQFSAISDDELKGTVTVTTSPTCASPAVVTATAMTGYQFSHWSNESQENPLTLTVNSDTNLIAYFIEPVYVYIYDTVRIHDTVLVDVPYAVHDTLVVRDTVLLTEYVPVHDTTYIDVHDTTYINIPVHDTTILTDTVTLTEYVPVHDTTYINIPVHDTTIQTDTVTLTEYVPVHDTIYITQTDTVSLTQFDTITNTVFDTIDNYIYDTLTVTDTLWLTLTDTLWLHDTIIIYDTVYVTEESVDGLEVLNAKVYSSQGMIVVEGANGNEVTLFDINGRTLFTRRDYGTAIRFDVPVSGTYMIKIGNHPARKVVVIR